MQKILLISNLFTALKSKISHSIYASTEINLSNFYSTVRLLQSSSKYILLARNSMVSLVFSAYLFCYYLCQSKAVIYFFFLCI